jgi:SAM-dependent methyltransferase
MKEQTLGPDFWRARYQTGQTGWDLGAPSPNVQRLVRENLAPGASIIIPGCGRGHDARALAKAGYRVTAMDLAPEAVAEARAAAEREGVEVDWVVGNLFDRREEWHGTFDAWVELTCYCAIDPELRPGYVEQAHRWLKQGGIVASVIFINLPEGGPPFNSTQESIEATFGKRFKVERSRLSPDSVPARAGKEWENIFRK